MKETNEPLKLASFGERLTFARKRLRPKVSQTKLASIVGIKQSSLSELETGETKLPSSETLLALAKALGVRSEWLIRNELPMMSSRPSPALGLEDPGTDYLNLYNELGSLWHKIPPRIKVAMLEIARTTAAAVDDAGAIVMDLITNQKTEKANGQAIKTSEKER